MHLCDTNVLSELTRRQPNDGVLAWAGEITTVTISVVTLEEILFGLAWRPIPRIAAWFDRFFEDRCEILPVAAEVARVSGQLRGHLQAKGQDRTQADMLIAATAKLNGLTLVTRNIRHFEGCGVPILNPFT
jgi:predicted nucleic acid-binding protein